MALAMPGPVLVKTTPRPAHPRIGIGHVRPAHLATRHDVAQRIALTDRIQHRDVVDRDDAEDGRDADLRQEVCDEIGDGVLAGHVAFPL